MRAATETNPPPTRLPPPCSASLPSVLVSPGMVRDVHRAEERPPRRRVHSTAEISRRPGASQWAWSAPPAIVSRPRRPPRPRRPTRERLTARIGGIGRSFGWRAWTKRSTFGYVLMLAPVALVVAALLVI
jgi:hypothetical protein